MPTLTLSLSQGSNHLVTHFNNFENDALYNKEFSKSTLEHLFIKPHFNVVNYYPRTILFDYSNGFGGLNPLEIFEEKVALPQYQQIKTSVTRETLNNYQVNLNKGIKVELDRTKYWTDYSNVVYSPNSIFKLTNYVYDFSNGKGINKDFQTQEFNKFEIGVNEYKLMREDVEDSIRYQLEHMDNVERVNLVCDFDSSWSGFASDLLGDLIDDQFNGDSSRILYWGLLKDFKELNNAMKYNRIRSFLDSVSKTGVFLPLKLDLNLWKSMAWNSLPFYELNENPMHDLYSNFGKGDTINEIFIDSNEDHHLNSAIFSSPSTSIAKKGTFSKLEYTLTANLSLDTLPSDLKNMNQKQVTFEKNDKVRTDFKSMSDFLSKNIRGGDHIDLRNEYIEQLNSLKENYTYGFEYYTSDEEEENY